MNVKMMIALAASVCVTAPALAGPVVREAAGSNPAAIQAAVDAFRADLGQPNQGQRAGDASLADAVRSTGTVAAPAPH